MNRPILIFDCHAICHAAKHGFSGLTYRGEHTGVIYGFLTKILSLAVKFDTNKLVFAWDSGKSFRKQIYPEYKKKDVQYTEEEIEENEIFRRQVAKLRTEVIPELGFTNSYIQTGMEADDIIASIVLTDMEEEKIVVSDDRDLYQLLSHCSMFKIKKKKLYTKKNLRERWNCDPPTWVHVKRIAGCTGDKVPNIPRVKEKTAIKYFNGTMGPAATYRIFQFCKENPEFIERNRKLTQLPFVGTKEIYLKPFDPLNWMQVNWICDGFGFDSLLRKSYLRAWELLCASN